MHARIDEKPCTLKVSGAGTQMLCIPVNFDKPGKMWIDVHISQHMVALFKTQLWRIQQTYRGVEILSGIHISCSSVTPPVHSSNSSLNTISS